MSEVNQVSVDELLIHTTVRIVANGDGFISTGTGFFYQFPLGDKLVPTVITNKHVLEGAKTISLSFTTDNSEKETFVHNLNVDEKTIIDHPNNNVDLCVILIGSFLNIFRDKKFNIVFLSSNNIIGKQYIENNISNIEDITVVGYPDGIIDEYNNLPVVRRGITATSLKYDFNKRKEFLIDCAIYNGSSGSPVYIFNQGSYAIKNKLYSGNRIFLVGIVYAVAQHSVDGNVMIKQAPTRNVLYSEMQIPNNLGVVIKAEKLLDFEPIIKEKIKL